MRIRRTLIVLALITAVSSWTASLTGRALERRISRALAEHAPQVSVAGVRFSWLSPLRFERVALELPQGVRLEAEAVDVTWTFAGGRDPRQHLRGVAVHGLHVQRGDLAVEAPLVAADLVAWEKDDTSEHLRLRQLTGGIVDVRHMKGAQPTHEVALSLESFDLTTACVRWQGDCVLIPGVWSGQLGLRAAAHDLTSAGALSARDTRVALPGATGAGQGSGAPSAVALSWDLKREDDRLELRRATVEMGALAVAARGRASLASDQRVDLALSARGEIASAFAAAGVPLPAALGGSSSGELGTATFEATVRGPLAEPAALDIVPRLTFEVAPRATATLAYLRGPFRYRPEDAPGLTIDLRADAPSFVPLAEVPPLFLRTLLISEDAGFYGHPGVDVVEIPVAFAANLERGGPARGASTITQQLVKNLFLSREKSYSRKLEEAALALLVDAAVPKSRLLEIYLNVIEWGPRLHGLGPAARHYFGKAPQDLTPKETAFLVCLIPNPVRYHQAHSAGHAGPGMERLMRNLLGKLRSVDALSDEEYAQALDEELQFAPESGGPTPEVPAAPEIRRTSFTTR